MTPQEFYDGPARQLTELALAKRALMAAPENERDWLRRTLPYWERVCRFCRRPTSRSCNIYEDLATVLASVIQFAQLYIDCADIVAEADAVMRPKMLDYAGDERFSANFERQARRAGISPSRVWAVFASKHWDAVASFVARGRVESEPIQMRLVDVVNYCQLLAGMVAAEVA